MTNWSMYVVLQGCPPFSHLTLTGGAIGSGPPMAVGAAVACPHRCVINIQVQITPSVLPFMHVSITLIIMTTT